MPNKLFNKKDFLIISVILIISIISYFIYIQFFNSANSTIAEILIDDTVIYTTVLDEDKEFTLPELPNITFEISSGKIRFLHSDCPDKVCVNTGFISHAGQLAVCLPNHAVLKISSTDEVDITI